PVEKAVPITYSPVPAPTTDSSDKPKMSKVVILTRQNRFETLKVALEHIGITGITVTQVLGCGMQKGASAYYRGVPLDLTLLPKVKVEVVVCKIPVETVVETARNALYTGTIGDGKIFVYNVEKVVKVRTGEEDYAALQDSE
ncbi:MAG: P-II family nitrogen regulator, partial [Eubacteriales bacterium]|nr:P-II family nitrogen regulator [Eubacteriales bacterium]